MKPDYVSKFPKVRHSSSNLLSDTEIRDIALLLGGSEASKLFSLKIEAVAYAAIQVLEVQGEVAGMNYSDSRARITDILKTAKSLSLKLKPISSRKPTVNSAHDWKTNKLIASNLRKPDRLGIFDEFSLWTIEESLHSLVDATESALTEIEGKKNHIEHPIQYFCHQSISIYEGFFKASPSIQRESNFVQAIDIIVKKANLLPKNKPYTTFNFLSKAKEHRLNRKRINSLGFFND